MDYKLQHLLQEKTVEIASDLPSKPTISVALIHQDPVVQRIVSLTSSLRDQLV